MSERKLLRNRNAGGRMGAWAPDGRRASPMAKRAPRSVSPADPGSLREVEPCVFGEALSPCRWRASSTRQRYAERARLTVGDIPPTFVRRREESCRSSSGRHAGSCLAPPLHGRRTGVRSAWAPETRQPHGSQEAGSRRLVAMPCRGRAARSLPAGRILAQHPVDDGARIGSVRVLTRFASATPSTDRRRPSAGDLCRSARRFGRGGWSVSSFTSGGRQRHSRW